MHFCRGSEEHTGKERAKPVPCADLSPLVIETLDPVCFIPGLKELTSCITLPK